MMKPVWKKRMRFKGAIPVDTFEVGREYDVECSTCDDKRFLRLEVDGKERYIVYVDPRNIEEDWEEI